MSIRNLKHLFEPRSIAVIGASDEAHSVGATVLNNLVIGGFGGQIMPVNPEHDSLCGLDVFADIEHLPAVPDLAVICTPPHTVPDLIRQLGMRGVKAAIVLTSGSLAADSMPGKSMTQEILGAAKPHLLRILGPNSVGLLVPAIGLNASIAHTAAAPGKVAFVSQSGAMASGVLDWAKSRGIGFSKFISLGDSADVDFGDVLDYLASDADTRAILLYVEGISSARKFMSAARAAARSKPTLVIKAGRAPEAARAAAMSHTGALAGSDEVYDAAIRRAGMLRVYSTEDLFDAVETLARARPLGGDRLAIMSNGGGPGVMATDHLMMKGGQLSRLSEQTMRSLNEFLPPNWSHGNPVDMIGDAAPRRYVQTLETLLNDAEVDAVLFIHAPTALVPSVDVASAVAPIAKKVSRNVLACWLGGESVAPARATFFQAGIPTYDTPEKAVRGFMQMVHYRRNQELLREVPPSTSTASTEDRTKAENIVRGALAAGRNLLSEQESKQVLAAYAIPVVETRIATTADEAVRVAAEIGFPVALKIMSPDVVHKSDVGGVALDLEDARAVRAVAMRMSSRVRELRPDARLQGFTVQRMARRPEGRELIVGVATDPVFGPVILFGQGGVEVEITRDHAVALPPLNMVLARDLVSRTRVSRLLAGFRNRPPADVDAICRTLIHVSRMIVDIPEIVELDINPLLVDAGGVIALDARMRVAPAAGTGVDRLAIRPYPAELEEYVDWNGEPLLVRPVRPEDGQQHLAFFNALDQEDIRYRIFTRMRELQPSQLARLTQIDYDREMAFIAVRRRPDGELETLGVARAIS
ncbi:MAG: family N-acetyltransferase, partial [Noviherbaspirillum sp.]|nr:family N-acetyltransferase [Noviherbaspirillum sp.]